MYHDAEIQDTKVEVKDPLKQGLKLSSIWHISTYEGKVEVKDPLKQGLKPNIGIYQIQFTDRGLK